MGSAPGRNRCRTLVILSLVVLWPLSLARGQEAAVESPPAVRPTVPAPPPSLPLLLSPFGTERSVTETPIRLLPLAPPEEAGPPLWMQTFITVDEEFTDNANETKDNRKSEFRTSVSPGLAARIERPETSLDFVYAPRFWYPSRLSDAELDHDLTLRSSWNASPFIRFSAAEDLVKSSDFAYQQNPAACPTGTAEYLTNQGTLEAAYLPSNGRLGLSYSNVLQRSDAPGADSSLTHIVRTDGQVSNPRLTLSGSYALTRGEFDINSPYWEHSVDARATRVLTSTISGTLSGWFAYHEPDRDPNLTLGRARLGGTGTLGPYGSLAVEAGAGVFAQQDSPAKVRPSLLANWTQQFAAFSLSARYQQDFQENFQQVTNMGVTFSQSAGVFLTTTGLLYRDLTATLRAEWGETRYQLTVTGPQGVAAGTVDRTWNLGGDIRYLILRPLAVIVGYTATLRTSTQSNAGFLENRVHFGLTYQYSIF